MDKIDREILGILTTDGRCGYRELGERVHLSANAVAERVRRLVRNGTIRSFRAEVDPAALGLTVEAQIDVKLRPSTSAAEFEQAIRTLPQVRSAALMRARSTMRCGSSARTAPSSWRSPRPSETAQARRRPTVA